VTIIESGVSVWEALAGRAPGRPVGPADPGLWSAVADRINPAKARPVLRAGVEMVELVSARGVPYVMLRSPDHRTPCYLRLTPEEARLAHLMDGTRTVARLVAEFTHITGRLAPDQVRRVVADLAGNRMLEELPVDAFAPLNRVRRRPWPLRLGRALLQVAQGRRMVVANIDPLVTFVYRAGGRLLFTRVVAALLGTVAVLGLAAFGYQWWTGEQSVFLSGNSYVTGALVLLGLNVFALACHELGHALATKHAGRRVPNAGFLIYFGIPSVFVDTSDVWMAGRRARLLATAAGPATGLVLAGASSLVGFAVPAAAPICFKLAFAWYLNALFNLNPFLALDGYYLLMDWLEIPNLRARGLAWIAARVRRRPPSWSALDREGRLVALYGLLAVGWLIVAANIVYRLYVDRVGGLVTGLWRAGWGARLLLLVVALALISPIVYVVVSWSGRTLRRLVRRFEERRVERDEPRRLAALRESSLGDLPDPVLRALAAQSRWRHPRTGEQVVFAGAAQPYVFVVVEGALEARRPGDPGGTVRERVGRGGVVGLAAALAGTPPALAWHTAGTTLLAIPSATIAATVGPLAAGAGVAYGTPGEVEQLFAETPALADLSTEDKMGLAQAAVPVALAPGAPLMLERGDAAVVVASGTVVTPDGQQLGRGTMVGPVGLDFSGAVATARTAVRAFTVPAVAGLPFLLGQRSPQTVSASGGGRAPVTGVHPPATYPPLSPPPGPPPPTVDDSADGRFERRLRWLLILVLLLALLFSGANAILAAKPWTEMPRGRAWLHVEVGTVTAVVNGITYHLADGDNIYVSEADSVTVDARSLASLTYHGGASSLLCAGTDLRIGPLSHADRPVAPTATYELRRGRAINDTASVTPAFRDLSLTVRTDQGVVRNAGTARYAVTPSSTLVSAGTVFVDAARQRETGGELDCGAGSAQSPMPTTSATPQASATPSATPSPSPSPEPSPSPSAEPSPSASPTPTNPPATSAPPVNRPPRISWSMDPTGAQITPKMDTAPCDGRSPVTVTAAIRDGGVGGIDQVVRVAWSWTGFITGGVTQTQPTGPGEWSVTIGTITYDGKPIQGGTFTVTATAFDQHGQSTTLTSGPVTVMPCIDTEPPTILGVIPSPLTIYWSTQCGSLQSTLTVRATDNSGLQLAASARYQVGDIWFDAGLNRTGFNEWTGVIGPISERLNTRTVIPIAVSVRDAAGNIREGSTSILFDPCIIIT
jgi:cAMP-binding proteins - catabolite gene activator and regulatory subunit of cAMP-dependent protein kinases